MLSTEPRPLRILVTDDERTILDAYKVILQSSQHWDARAAGRRSAPQDDTFDVMGWRYRLTLCARAEDAVAEIQQAATSDDPFAMAFFDVRMPPGLTGGLWAAEQMRAIDPDAAIVIVTGANDVDARELVQRIPPADRLFYIQKPFHPREVIQFVLALGARWEAERMLRRANEELERKVQERTQALAAANRQLREEIAERERAEERIRSSLREKEILLKEIHHRVKNNLQITSSLLRLQRRHGRVDAGGAVAGGVRTKAQRDRAAYALALRDSESRIRSMALIHEVLYESGNLDQIDIADYVGRLMEQLSRSYGPGATRAKMEVDAEHLLLGIDVAVPCGLIINELVTNAIKHAFPEGVGAGDERGAIRVTVQQLADGRIELMVADNGQGLPESVDLVSDKSLGLRLVRMLAQDQLQGEVTVDRSQGTAFRVTFKGAAS